ncbi:MAG TPA: hypothetical protein VGG29_17555 [Caulobacteraceae bacterium]
MGLELADVTSYKLADLALKAAIQLERARVGLGYDEADIRRLIGSLECCPSSEEEVPGSANNILGMRKALEAFIDHPADRDAGVLVADCISLRRALNARTALRDMLVTRSWRLNRSLASARVRVH